MFWALMLPVLALAPVDRLAEARDHLASGQAEAARQVLMEMLPGAGPAERDVRVLLAEAALSLEVPDEAATVLEPMADEADHEVQLLLGQSMTAWGDQQAASGANMEDIAFFYEEGRMYIEAAVALAGPGDARAVIAAAELMLYTFGDHEAALELLKRAPRGADDDGEVRLLQGCAGVYDFWNAQAAGRSGADKIWKRAVRALQDATRQLGPDRAEPFAQLAWLYEIKQRPDEAVEAALEAARRAPAGSLEALYRLALRFASSGEQAAAGRALLGFLELDAALLPTLITAEENPTATARQLSLAAFHFIDRGRLVPAHTLFAAITAADPDDADLWNNYGLLCRDTGRYEESFRAYARSVEIDDTDPRTLNDTGLILSYHLDRGTEAVAYYERAIELAERELAGGIAPDRRAYLKKALRDARSNLRKTAKGRRGQR